MRRQKSNEVRWVRPYTMHITLKFCGERQVETVKTLKDNLSLIQQKGPFSLFIGGVGAFPNIKRPRVVWAGIKGETNCLKDIRNEIESAALAASIPREEKPYNPHVTLGRRSSNLPLPESVTKDIVSEEILLEPWNVDEFILMRSELSVLCPRYTPLGLFKM